MTAVFEHYFDFISPFAYLSWQKVQHYKTKYPQVTFQHYPIFLGQVFSKQNFIAPITVPEKAKSIFRQCLWRAYKQNIVLKRPMRIPFNSVPLLRLCHQDVAGDLQSKVIGLFFDYIWREQKDGEDLEQVFNYLIEHGISENKIQEMDQKSRSKDIKNSIRSYNAKAINHGIFGVPSFFFQERLYWGDDQLEMVEILLNGGKLPF